MGHTPILRYTGKGSADGAIELRDVDYWTVQYLTFDGDGVSTSDTAIEVAATTRPISGVHLLHNTIRNWGLMPLDNRAVRAIYVHGNRRTGVTANHIVIRNNTLMQIRTNAMRIEGTQHAVIAENTLSQLKCGWHTADSLTHEAIKITSGQTRSQSPSNGTLIRRNHIYDFQSLQACLAEYGPAAGRPVFRGIYCDVNADDGRVVGNLIHTMSPHLTHDNLTRGVYIESRCDRWEVSENIVYDVAGACFRISASGHAVKLTHNVCYNAGLGIDYRGHDEVTITHNIIYLTRPEARVMRLDQRALKASHRIDYNLYFNRAAPLAFRRGKNSTGLLLWKLLCRCDAHSQNADPQFVDTESIHKDFHLQPSSPARRAGTAGVNIGTYP
jgi:nitrous oxidase accessory protein NosD